ncbi:hypothetical protein [uncultured Sphaerochaeta sp.]|uniref:hypothetical protein n=1 Tax=uncultured Sphaerochaeta sp. TaxID=886478 RepID=UPI002AA76EE0|nr:hypothetical protein [uncultured Sphaerochaeta sp.]
MITKLNITYIDFGPAYGQNSNSGIERKKLAQIKELSKLGNVKRLAYSPKGKRGVFKEATRMLPFAPSMFYFKYCPEKLDGVDIVYYRKAYIDRYAIKLLREIKRRNPKCIILFEIPTYPYDKEKSGLIRIPLMLKEKWNRRKLHKFVDRIVLVTSKEKEVFRIPTITSLNGIDFDYNTIRKIKAVDTEEVHAIMIGNFTFYHGIDRIIDGLITYYSNHFPDQKDFIVHIVGSGVGVKGYLEKCANAHLEEKIIFHGSLPFEEVNKVYDEVSIAINSIGRHRVTGTKFDSSIKSREYGAKGLPVVTEAGIPIDYLPDDYPFVLHVPADESPLDIESVMRFHERVYKDTSPQEIARKIRSIAESRCNAEAMMKPVLDYCEECFKERVL